MASYVVMHRHADRRFRSLAVSLFLASALVLSVAPARADDLPPQESPPFSAVYKLSAKSRAEATDEWTFTNQDTVTIAVLEKKSRWDHKSDGHTILIERGVASTTFGGKTPANTAVRSRMPMPIIGWEFGYGTIAAVAEEKAQVLGTTTIAGKECTRIALRSIQYGKPEFCITKNGIVLRFANKSSTAEAVYEAESVTETAPEKERFSVPAGYAVEERRGPNRNVQIF